MNSPELPISTENNNESVLNEVQKLRDYFNSNEFLLRYTPTYRDSHKALLEFLEQVEQNPEQWTKEKVNMEFMSIADRKSEPPIIIKTGRGE